MVLGLDMRFWAENAKNKCKSNKRLQILFGDNNQKSNGNSTNYPLSKTTIFHSSAAKEFL
jgi:hypothetical protein